MIAFPIETPKNCPYCGAPITEWEKVKYSDHEYLHECKECNNATLTYNEGME